MNMSFTFESFDLTRLREPLKEVEPIMSWNRNFVSWWDGDWRWERGRTNVRFPSMRDMSIMAGPETLEHSSSRNSSNMWMHSSIKGSKPFK